MTEIVTQDFNGVSVEMVRQDGDLWMTGEAVGSALGYAEPRKAIGKIFERNQEEMEPYTRVVKLTTQEGAASSVWGSEAPDLTTQGGAADPDWGSQASDSETQEGSAGSGLSQRREVRVFNEEGVMLLTMFSRQPIAQEFRAWAVKVLKAYRHGQMALTEPEGRDHMLELCIRESGKGNLAAQEVLMDRYGFSERIQGNLPQAPTDEPKPDWADWREVLEALVVALEKGRYRAPYTIQDFGEGEATVPCLALRLSDVAAHFNARRSLPGPVSGRILKRQLREAGVVYRDRVDVTIEGEREHHLVALSLAALEGYSMEVPRPEPSLP